MNTIEMKKFGIILNGRPEAKEAVARVRQAVNGSKEDIMLDFSGVEVLTPSFADELVRGISAIYPEKKIRYSGLEENESLRDTFVAVGIDIASS